jgi:hypothetical protein
MSKRAFFQGNFALALYMTNVNKTVDFHVGNYLYIDGIVSDLWEG